ncbi:hypothetical protein D0868_00707 [Hortaea werneckii]|uniref:Uncharacterized protein n=1 Tax=Hortaea werneckii TaxID=91943 RepID=A0A3M6ZKF8_HORWE|nr:hypothetical protein D0868_00707 [Hortaea werneckii]
MATAAGLILSALGLTTSLISFGTSNLPEPNASIRNGGRAICSYSDDSSIRVAVGLHGRDDPYNYKGSVDLRLYTTYGNVIGYPEVDKSINAGNRVYEVTICSMLSAIFSLP